MTTTGSAPLPDAATVEEWILGGGFHRWLGLRVAAVGPDSIELTATWREEWTNDSGADVTHGGIIGSLLDLAADWALVGSLGTAVPTIDFTTHYLRAAGRGDLRVVGRAIKPGRTVTFAEAEVYGPDGKLVATGRGSYASGVAAQIVAAREAAAAAAEAPAEGALPRG
jgi:uncharacterized protein (TIGR00369 family)